MTAQASDTVLYQGTIYSICGVSGAGLFQPSECGLEPVATSSACWRGYVVGYEIRDDLLTLSRLSIGLSSEDAQRAGSKEGIEVFGRRLEIQSKEHSLGGDFGLEAVDARIPFTGGLLLGADFIPHLYVHMGFHPAWKYRQVHELQFMDGEVAERKDLSEQMAEIRTRLESKSLRPDLNATDDEIQSWIQECFSLDYSGE